MFILREQAAYVTGSQLAGDTEIRQQIDIVTVGQSDNKPLVSIELST